MRVLYTLTIFLGSALLFLVQPMVAKMILPLFGGSPEVWNTSMVFFQGVLLLGYGYAHLSSRWLGARIQPWVHLALMLLPLLVLPIALPRGYVPGGTSNPAPLVLTLLGTMVGLPFFLVSAGSSLLQRWFAHTSDKDAKDPYFLYSASNVGSMIALLAYPLLLEPRLRLAEQSWIWTAGYGLLIFFTGLSVLAGQKNYREVEEHREEDALDTPVTNLDRFRWVGLAFVPSSLLLGVTTYLTTNIAAVPFLWVLPLSLYLITFIAAFAQRRRYKVGFVSRATLILAVPLSVVVILEASDPNLIWFLVPLHLLFFIVSALMCHGELSDLRPTPKHLTEFYFWIALGGVLGGAFNALFAPVAFQSIAEYPITIVLACLAAKYWGGSGRWTRADVFYGAGVALLTVLMVGLVRTGWLPFTRQLGPVTTTMMIGLPLIVSFFAIDRPARYAFSLGSVFLVSNLMQTSSDGSLMLAERSFFGVHRVVNVKVQMPKKKGLGVFHRLVHGNTIHGLECFEPGHIDEPLTYYSRTGPIGQVFKEFSGSRIKDEVALIGLGVGSLAAYGEPGQHMKFFEIDPVVKSIATNPKYFTFVEHSRARVDIELGDGRLSLSRERDGQYGLIVLDAFTSDAIPIHLLTRQAVALYLRKLQPGGVLAFHISNRYLELAPVLARLGQANGLVCRYQSEIRENISEDDLTLGKTPSEWFLMARRVEDFGKLADNGYWEIPEIKADTPLWTDDFSNILSVFNTQKEE